MDSLNFGFKSMIGKLFLVEQRSGIAIYIFQAVPECILEDVDTFARFSKLE